MIDMTILRERLPHTDNEVISDFFDQAASDAALAGEGHAIPEGEDILGLPRDLLPFELLRAHDVEPVGLGSARAVHAQLGLVLRDAVRGLPGTEMIHCLGLCMYGMLLGNYTEDDFRYVYRFSLSNGRGLGELHRWLYKALVFLSAVPDDEPEYVLARVREHIRFLGAPLVTPSRLAEAASTVGVDLSGLVREGDLRLVDTLVRHPEYMAEAVEGRWYSDVYDATKTWLPEGLQMRLFDIFRAQAYEQAQLALSPSMSVPEAVSAVQDVFRSLGFRVGSDDVLPVRLHELPAPPTPEPLDSVVFEMIPERMRRELLPSVAYSVPTRKVELIFIGGPGIGHSGIIIKTATGGVLLDYGLSVANQTTPQWVPELEVIDSVLVTHAHLDHTGGLPILFERFTGKWCSTPLTGAITKALLDDALTVGTPLPPRKRDSTDPVSWFRQRNIDRVAKQHVPIEVGKSSEVGPGIVVTPLDACHVPGSAAFLIDIEGLMILYTGDFNLDRSVLFPGAVMPTDPDVVIVDGTYWGRQDFDRTRVREDIASIVREHGPVIVPTFAVGRCQEILMILEELGITASRNVITGGLAERVTRLVGIKGHWKGMKKNKVVLDPDDILVAGGGMLGGGLAREHFRQHSRNPEAAVVLCGYLAPRTPGWNLLRGYEPHECTVHYARLSAHSSSSNLQAFAHQCTGKRFIVHTPLRMAPEGFKVPQMGQRFVVEV